MFLSVLTNSNENNLNLKNSSIFPAPLLLPSPFSSLDSTLVILLCTYLYNNYTINPSSHSLSSLAPSHSSFFPFFLIDLLDYNSMLAAVNGCSGVFHLSSPCIVDQVHDLKVRATSDQRNAQCSDGVSAPLSFEVPITNDVNSNFDGFQKEAIQMVKPAKGTTSLAFIFKDGVMVAADSRASMGGYTSFDHHSQNMMTAVEFVDYFPSMIARLGDEGFIGELCNGFRLLMDVEKGLITFESLKSNCLLLGLHDMGDDELVWMLMEGDLDGDGALSQMEFCILMFRLSPGLMDGSKELWMEDYDHRRVNDHQIHVGFQ
ncbi:hypothetical protein ACFX2J_007431 [Malus domestica]